MGGAARGDGRPGTEGVELKPIEPHTFAQLPLDEEIATATKTRPDLTALAQTQSAQAVAVGAAQVSIRPKCERLRELGGRPGIARQFGRQQLGGRGADQR